MLLYKLSDMSKASRYFGYLNMILMLSIYEVSELGLANDGKNSLIIKNKHRFVKRMRAIKHN